MHINTVNRILINPHNSLFLFNLIRNFFIKIAWEKNENLKDMLQANETCFKIYISKHNVLYMTIFFLHKRSDIE